MQRVSSQDAQEFHRIIAADDTWLFKTLDTYYKGDKQKEKNFFENVSEKLFGEKKSPLDMTPDELARLTRLTFDAKDDSTIEVTIQPEDLEEDAQGKSASDMKFIVDSFYNKNSRYFAHPDNLDFDPDTWTLYYKGRTRLAKKLLKEMGVKEDVIKKTMTARKGGILNLEIPVVNLVDTDQPEFENIDNIRIMDTLRRELKTACGNKVTVDYDFDPPTEEDAAVDSPHGALPDKEEHEENGVLHEQVFPGIPEPEKKKEEKISDPVFQFRGQKMDIYEGLKKAHSLDQMKVKQIFEGDLRRYMK